MNSEKASKKSRTTVPKDSKKSKKMKTMPLEKEKLKEIVKNAEASNVESLKSHNTPKKRSKKTKSQTSNEPTQQDETRSQKENPSHKKKQKLTKKDLASETISKSTINNDANKKDIDSASEMEYQDIDHILSQRQLTIPFYSPKPSSPTFKLVADLEDSSLDSDDLVF
jgi:hypothetical protein